MAGVAWTDLPFQLFSLLHLKKNHLFRDQYMSTPPPPLLLPPSQWSSGQGGKEKEAEWCSEMEPFLATFYLPAAPVSNRTGERKKVSEEVVPELQVSRMGGADCASCSSLLGGREGRGEIPLWLLVESSCFFQFCHWAAVEEEMSCCCPTSPLLPLVINKYKDNHRLECLGGRKGVMGTSRVLNPLFQFTTLPPQLATQNSCFDQPHGWASPAQLNSRTLGNLLSWNNLTFCKFSTLHSRFTMSNNKSLKFQSFL